MPTVNPSSVPSPRGCLGWDGANFYVLRTDAEGHLQIHALSSALPLGAATLAEQQTQTTALQLIDDLRDVLQSVATDRLQVRGEDQLVSVRGVLQSYLLGTITGADGYIESAAVPAGRIWVVTTIASRNSSRDLTGMGFRVYDGAVTYPIYEDRRAIVNGEYASWSGHTYLEAGDTIRVQHQGAQDGDGANVTLTGHVMTVEV